MIKLNNTSINKKLKIVDKLLFILSKKDKLFLWFLLIFSIFISAIETIGISIIMPFLAVATDFNLVESNEHYNLVYNWLHFETPKDFVISFGILLIIFYILRSAINLIYFYTLNRFSEGRYQIIASKLFRKYMSGTFNDFVQKNSSTMTKTIMHESSNLTHLIQQVLLLFSEFFVLIFIYSMIIYVNYEITLTLTAILFLNGLLLTKTVSREMKRLGVIRADVQTKFYEIINKNFGNFKIIKLNSNNKNTFEEFNIASLKLVSGNIKAATLSQFPKLFLEAIGFSLIVAIIIYLIYKENGDISSTLAVLSVFVLALYRLLPSVNRIMSSYNSIMFHYKALDIIYNDLIAKHEVLGTDLIKFENKIVLSNLYFKYKENENTLENINLVINRGDKIAFIGESGSGKSTIVDLIIGLHKPTLGKIKIDENVLTDKNIISWRKKIGYIPQNVYLFDGSIADNVVFGREYSQEKIIYTLKKAHIYNFLESKDGIDTQVGEGGVLLSGGQKQRIAIARALYGEPEILVLDEATSALDNETESKIMEEVYNVSVDMTLIIIAHRLSTIERCENIYKLEKGRINR